MLIYLLNTCVLYVYLLLYLFSHTQAHYSVDGFPIIRISRLPPVFIIYAAKLWHIFDKAQTVKENYTEQKQEWWIETQSIASTMAFMNAFALNCLCWHLHIVSESRTWRVEQRLVGKEYSLFSTQPIHFTIWPH